LGIRFHPSSEVAMAQMAAAANKEREGARPHG